MERYTKLKVAVGESALGTAAMLASLYAPVSDNKKLALGLGGVILTAHGSIQCTKITDEIEEEKMEKAQRMMNDYMNYVRYNRTRWGI